MSTNAISDPENQLMFMAESLDDIEDVRVAMENRLRSILRTTLQASGMDPDEIIKGFTGKQLVEFAVGVSPDLRRCAELAATTIHLEHQATLDLQRAMRSHPLSEFVETTKGIGLKQGARLIAAIGDPYMKAAVVDRDTGELLEPERPRRGPAELWAYCGFVPGQKRKKGIKSNWNPQAKMRAFLIAKSVEHLPAGSAPLRVLYDETKIKKHGMIHDAPCQQCAGKGKPPENAIGVPWKDGHIQAHALRIVAKTILKDLYIAAREVYDPVIDQVKDPEAADV